jgi:hypothetical protein
LMKRDRAPTFERPVPRTPHGACSSQVLPRHTRGAPYRCSLPGLAGFDASRCVGPNLRRRPTRLTRHDTPSGGNSTPLERIAGYRAPLPPRLARPHPSRGSQRLRPRTSSEQLAERAGFEPAIRLPVYGISSAAPSAARSPLRITRPRQKYWRRGEDLNPRGTYAPIRFRVGRLQPGSATPPRTVTVVAFQRTRATAPRSRRRARRRAPAPDDSSARR